MKFPSSFIQVVLASIVSVSVTSKSTVADVESDIATITSRTQALYEAISSFPDTGGSVTNALSIHFDVVNLRSSIDKASVHVKGVTPIPVSLEDGKILLAAMQFLKPIIINALEQIVVKKAAFQSLALGAATYIIKQDLDNLNASVLDLGSAMIAFAPPELVSPGNEIKADVDAALGKAIAAYT